MQDMTWNFHQRQPGTVHAIYIHHFTSQYTHVCISRHDTQVTGQANKLLPDQDYEERCMC